MITLLSEDCEVINEKRGGESVLVCITSPEKCQKQKHNPNIGAICGKISRRCIKA